MKWFKRFALAMGVLIAIAGVVPFFITLDDYIPLIEQEISARMGKPVSIDSLHAFAFPTPHGRINGITIGTLEDIKVGQLTFKPDLWSFFGSQKIVRSVELEDVTLSYSAIGSLFALTQGDMSSSNVRVQEITLQNVALKFDESSFGPFDVKVQLSTGQEPVQLVLTTRDGAFKARVTPESEHYLLDISARSWTPPIRPAIRIDALAAKGVATTSNIEMNDVRVHVYGGTISGKIAARWTKGVGINGALDVDQLDLKRAASAFSQKISLTGRLSAKPKFTASAPEASQLDESLRLETRFTVHDGVLHGFDIMSIASNPGKPTQAPGETRFDQLAGHLVMENRTYRFSDLRIGSGPFTARGAIKISPSKALSGQLDSNVKVIGNSVSIPLIVSGTLDAPAVYPNPTALAAAAAGRAGFDPRIGSAAGAAIGELAEKIFSPKK